MVVGAGPAGATTALALLRARPDLAGRVALLERQTLPRPKVCAGAVGGRALWRLQRLGVTPHELCDASDATPVEVFGLAVSTVGGTLFQRHPRPIGWVVRRGWFDHALTRAAARRGAEVLAPRRYLSHRYGADGLVVHTDQGPLRTSVLVGADGVSSAVRRVLALPRGDTYAQAEETDTRWVPSDLGSDLLHFDLRPGPFPGYAWDFPTLSEGRSAVCRGVYALVRSPLPRDGRHARAHLDAHLERRGLGAGDTLGPRRRFAERGLPLAQPLSRPRVILVGEAAGIDPTLGEGIAQAVHYGDLAGTWVAEALGRADVSMHGWRTRVHGSRLGRDLRLRRWLLPFVYGRSRPHLERLVTHSSSLAKAGQHYFAGERVPRLLLARTLFDAWSVAVA